VKSEEFFREVDEDLQRDRMLALWRRYGGLMVAAAVLLVLGTAGWVGWQAWHERQLVAEAERFNAAVEALQNEPATAIDQLEGFAAEADTGYAALAHLRAAGAALAAKKDAEAETALQALAGDPSRDALLRDLAAVLAASRELQTADPADLRARLEPLAAAGAPYRYTARELLALLALRTGNTDEARRMLEELSREVGLPERQGRRIAETLASLGEAKST
jgi:hypothetical protein